MKRFWTNYDLGDFIEVAGSIIKTQSGEITVDADNLTLLTKSIRPLPSSWYGLNTSCFSLELIKFQLLQQHL